jgi:tartrate dehydratase beta subunit/fumarate hydratase class I family protein
VIDRDGYQQKGGTLVMIDRDGYQQKVTNFVPKKKTVYQIYKDPTDVYQKHVTAVQCIP